MQKQSSRWGSALVLAAGVAVLCTMFPADAAAQTWNRKTTVTFNQPVEIPGVGAQVLPAGTYVFRLLDSMSDRHIVQVFNQDETHVYSTILAIPNYRLRATDKTVITFAERAAGEPQAIRAWFYPGDVSGQEFVYPKTRAVVLAKTTSVPVLYIPDTAIDAEALRGVSVAAINPSGADIAMTDVVETPPVRARELPKTAGSLPLFALIGLLSMAASYSLKRFSDC